MKEELKNLTPEMVEELKQLGVEFEDTQDVWRKQLTDWRGYEPIKNMKEWRRMPNSSIIVQGMTSYETLPAPNLSEVLEKLPQVLKKWNYQFEYTQTLCLEVNTYSTESKHEYGIGYNSHLFYDNNLLLASFSLLKWIATNYPESLIKNN